MAHVSGAHLRAIPILFPLARSLGVWEYSAVPKISAPSLAAHRKLRRQQIISAAAELALEGEGRTLTMSAIAARAGISRTAIYEYFASTSDLLADLIIDELKIWSTTLEEIVASVDQPGEQVEAWIKGALSFVADGRHNLVKALSAVSMPIERSGEISASHRRLVAPLVSVLKNLGVEDAHSAAFLINSAVESATKRIEQGADAEKEIALTVSFARAGVEALARG